MIPHILAVDDDPPRFDGLRRLIGDRVKLTVAACPTCVHAALPTASAVLLDYDLDSGDPCPACFASYGLWSDTSKGIHYAPAIRRVARISALEVECELRWIGQLWAWGVL